MSLAPYREQFKAHLAEGRPEIIDEVYAKLLESERSFHTPFFHQFPAWVSLYYFQPVVEPKHQLEIIPEWQVKVPDWKELLQQGLMSGRAGRVARALRESLEQHLASRQVK